MKIQNKQINNRGLSKWHILERLHSLQGKIYHKTIIFDTTVCPVPSFGYNSLWRSTQHPGKKTTAYQEKKKTTKETVECSFLFESKKQPLYCTYTEINNNHMNMKYLVIFFLHQKTAIYSVN